MPGREPMTNQSKDSSTKAQIANYWDLLGNMSKGLHIRTEMTQRQLYHYKAHPRMDDSAQKLEIWSLLHSLQAAEQVENCPFQVAQLVWASSRKVQFI